MLRNLVRQAAAVYSGRGSSIVYQEMEQPSGFISKDSDHVLNESVIYNASLWTRSYVLATATRTGCRLRVHCESTASCRLAVSSAASSTCVKSYPLLVGYCGASTEDVRCPTTVILPLPPPGPPPATATQALAPQLTGFHCARPPPMVGHDEARSRRVE